MEYDSIDGVALMVRPGPTFGKKAGIKYKKPFMDSDEEMECDSADPVPDFDGGILMTDSAPAREIFCVDAAMSDEPDLIDFGDDVPDTEVMENQTVSADTTDISSPSGPSREVYTTGGAMSDNGNPDEIADQGDVVIDDGTFKKLIDLVKLNGSFEMCSEFAKLLNRDVTTLEQAAGDIDKSVFATILALEFLKKYFTSRQVEWNLIVAKSYDWLKDTWKLDDKTMDEYKENARNVLP